MCRPTPRSTHHHHHQRCTNSHASLQHKTSASMSHAMQAVDALDLDNQDLEAGEDLLREVLLGHHMVDFWLNLAVCHSLIVEDHPTLGKVFQVRPSCSSSGIRGTPRRWGWMKEGVDEGGGGGGARRYVIRQRPGSACETSLVIYVGKLQGQDPANCKQQGLNQAAWILLSAVRHVFDCIVDVSDGLWLVFTKVHSVSQLQWPRHLG